MRLKELYQDKVCLLSYHWADCLAGELMQLQSPKGLCVAQCGPAAVTQRSVGTDLAQLYAARSSLLSSIHCYSILIFFPFLLRKGPSIYCELLQASHPIIPLSSELPVCRSCWCALRFWGQCCCLPKSFIGIVQWMHLSLESVCLSAFHPDTLSAYLSSVSTFCVWMKSLKVLYS